MELTKMNTVVRPRTSWQAVDLGFTMARQWYIPLLLSWLMFSAPILLILCITLSEMTWPIILITWWLKPLWEAAQLNYISLALFGQHLTFKEQWQQWRKIMAKRWFTYTISRRLSLQRSYLAPILQLENLPNNKYTNRRGLFGGSNQQAAQWLTITLQQLEGAIVIAIVILISYLIPEQVSYHFDPFEQIENDGSLLLVFIYYFALAIIAPFFTCSGFSLYLNQRTQIEGWDIEVAFKRMSERIKNLRQAKKPTQSALTLLITMTLSINLLNPSPLQASEVTLSEGEKITKIIYRDKSINKTKEQIENGEIETVTIESSQTTQQKQSQTQILDIITSKSFNQTTTEVNYQLIDFELDQPEQEEKNQTWSQWLESLLSAMANSVQVLLTIAIIIAVVLLIAIYLKWYQKSSSSHIQRQIKPQPQQVKQLFGLDLTAQSLPPNPAEHALKYWQQDQIRQALSLLYRASLARLIEQQHIIIKDSFTEGECLQQVNANAAKEVASYFQLLTQNWQNLAYAERLPSERTMQQLIDQWASQFPNQPRDTKA